VTLLTPPYGCGLRCPADGGGLLAAFGVCALAGAGPDRAFTIGKVFLYDVSELDRGYRIVSFIVLGVLLLAISFMYQRDWLKLSSRNHPKESPAGT
jgi:hypothetical protein